MTVINHTARDIERWTPGGLHEICGCSSITRLLAAYARSPSGTPNLLITGPRGSGKTSTVNAFLQTLICPFAAGDPPRRCGQCKDCLTFDTRYHDWGFWSLFRPRVLDHGKEALNFRPIDCRSTNEREIRETIEWCREFASTSQCVVYLDEVDYLKRNQLDGLLLKPLEELDVLWIATCETRSNLAPMFVRRFTLRKTTTSPSIQELTLFLADRCRDFAIDCDETTLQMLAQRSRCSVSECIRVLALSASGESRRLTREIIQGFDFLEDFID